ncbi:MAG: hypothetical protein ACYSWW_11455 [Planctomycetota bacterium]|jgi:hypothetical protein
MNNIKVLETEFLNALFNSNVIPRIRTDRNQVYPNEFTDDEKKRIEELITDKHTVLGFDIYRCSQYPREKQPLLPHLFAKVYQETWGLITQNFEYIFQRYNSITNHSGKLKAPDYYIDTGDGCFQIFESPVHAVIFVLVFGTILQWYNSDRFMPKLHSKIGNMFVRYALTYDNIYRYDRNKKTNFFGAGIINNARILSKDKLNRFLIDEETFRWFLTSMSGIENLMSISLKDLEILNEFSSYDDGKMEKQNALIRVDNKKLGFEGIKSVDVQKIGTIQEKKSEIDIYNLHLQATIEYSSSLSGQSDVFTISVGNLNTAGLGDFGA